MKKTISVLLSFLIILLQFGALEAASGGTTKEVTVVFTHDLHSYLDTKTSEVNGEIVEIGGFAKVKTILDDIRANNNTIVVDGGDYSMGTLYQTVFKEQAIELRILGFLGYDVVTLGNHEFDYGSDGLSAMLRAAMNSGDRLPEIVATNIDYESSPSQNAKLLEGTMNEYGVQDYLVLEQGDVNVAVFGGMGEDAAKSAPSSELIFRNIVDQAKMTVSEIEENEDVDIIIYLSHAGTFADPESSEDEILAREVPEIDVIVSGHTHTYLEEPIITDHTYIVSSGEYGQNVGRIDLVQTEDGNWDIKDYNLIAVNQDIESDEETLGVIDDYREYVNEFLSDYGFESYDQVIAYSPFDFTSLREMNETHGDQAIGNLISDAIIHGTEQAEGESYIPIDVSVVPIGIIRASFNEGPITISDIYEVMSLGIGPDGIPGYPLTNVYLTGQELKALAEIDASISPLFSSAQLFTSGLSYTFNPNRIFLNRATDIKLDRGDGVLADIDNDKLYRVVADLYSAQMLGAVTDLSKGILSLELKDVEGSEVDDYNDLILYDSEGNEVKEWQVLASYMQSFEAVDGVPTILEEYENAQNRKVLDDSKDIASLVRQPNKISIAIAVVALLLLALFVFLIRFIVRRVRRKRAHR